VGVDRQRTGRRPGARAALALASLTVLAASPAARAASISIDGGAIVLGQRSSAPVTIRVDEEPGQEHRPLRLSASVGSFGEPTRVGSGVYRATYFAPDTRFPQLALVTIWKETGRDAKVDWVSIPLFGASRVPVRARRGASVTIASGFDTFGPVVAGKDGLAVVPIAVPPNVREAVVHVRDGETTKRRIPIETGPYNQLVAAIVPSAMAADGADFARLHVVYRDGGADTHERIRVAPSVGEVRLETASHGRCTYRYVPPAGTPEKEVTFAISVAGDPLSTASARIALSFPPPAKVFVVPPQVALEPGSGAVAKVAVQATSADGLGLPDLAVAVTANGVPLAGETTYRGDGVYEVAFAAPAERPPDGVVELRARAVDRSGRSATGVATYRLAAPPAPARAPRERWDAGVALVGARAGFGHALDELSGGRAGVEAWLPFRAGDLLLYAGLTASAARARRDVHDVTTGAVARSRVVFAPVSLRLGLELFSTRRLSAVLGAGGVAAVAQSRTDLSATASTAVGFGGLGFLSLGLALGRAQLFGEVSYGTAPVANEAMRLDAGGLSVDVGLRFGVR
jgi:hypothetical protein